MKPQLINRSVDHYQILSLAGDGSLGPVYRARDTRLGLEVALQILLRSAGSRDGSAWVRQAAQQAAALDYPGLVVLRDYGQIDRRFYLVTEWLNGTNLQSIVQNAAAAPALGLDDPLARAALVSQVSTAVHYLHGQGIYRRDLRPNNIIVLDDRRPAFPVLTDLGLLTLDQSHLEAYLGQLDDGPERLAYLAPEYLTGQPPDERSDIYSLGRLLYTLLRGPVEFTDLAEARQALSHSQPPEWGDLDPGLAKIIRQAMASDPAERYPSAQALAQDLEAVINSPKPAYEPLAGASQQSEGIVAASAAGAAAIGRLPPTEFTPATTEADRLSTETGPVDDLEAIAEPAGRPSLTLQLKPLHLTATPGRKTKILQAIVTNIGSQSVQIGLTVRNLPPEWLELEPPLETVKVSPGQDRTFFLNVTPQAVPETRPAAYEVVVSVVDQTQQVIAVEERLEQELQVLPFSRFESELGPAQIKVGQPVKVTVKNRGNIDQTYRLVSEDLSNELELTPATRELTVKAGHDSSTTFRPIQRRRRLWGWENYPFSIQITPISGQNQSLTGAGQSQRQTTTAAARPMLTPRRLSLGLLVGLILSGLGVTGLGMTSRFWPRNPLSPRVRGLVDQVVESVNLPNPFQTPDSPSENGEEPPSTLSPGADDSVPTAASTGSSIPESTPGTGQSSTNQAPTGRITTSPSGRPFEPGEIVTIEVKAADPERRIRKVEFFANDEFINEDAAPPYRYDWLPNASGSIELTAIVVDVQGQATETSSLIITVKATPTPEFTPLPSLTPSSTPLPTPDVEIKRPGNGDSYTQATPILIEVMAKTISNSNIVGVDFRADYVDQSGKRSWIQQVTAGTGDIYATPLPPNIAGGDVTLTASARDTNGKSGTDKINITITNVPPKFTNLIFPEEISNLFYQWQEATITGTAEDFDNITSVVLLRNDISYDPANKDCKGLNSPSITCSFTLTFRDLEPAQEYRFKVEATDSYGEKSTSRESIPLMQATPTVEIRIIKDRNPVNEVHVGDKVTFGAQATTTGLVKIEVSVQTPNNQSRTSQCPPFNNDNSNGLCGIENYSVNNAGSYTLTAKATYPENINIVATRTIVVTTPTPTEPDQIPDPELPTEIDDPQSN